MPPWTGYGHRRVTRWTLEADAVGRRFHDRTGWVLDGTTRVDEVGGVLLPEVRYARSLPAARPS